MPRILLVERDADLALRLRGTLEADGYHVEITADGDVVAPAPDLVILDLAGSDAALVTRLDQLRRTTGVPILGISRNGTAPDHADLSRVDAVVARPFTAIEVVARVESLLRRRPRPVSAPDPAIAFGDVRVERATRRVTRGPTIVQLTPKEFDLLVALCDERGAVMTRTALLERVWGYRAGVVSRTVDTHVGELRRKLEPDPGHPQYIITVRGRGYRLAVPELIRSAQ